MIARALVAKRPFDDYKIGRHLDWKDLAGRCHADEKLATGGKELLGDQDREGCADGAADDAKAQPFMIEDMEVGVIAGPQRKTACTIRRKEMTNDVTVGIEDADFGNGP